MDAENQKQKDEDLALLVQSGKADFFGELVKRYEDKITRYAKKFLSDHDDVKDVVQQVFLKSYVNIQSFDSRRKFSPWIYRIAHNELVNEMRKKNRKFLPIFDLDVFFPRHLIKKDELKDSFEKKELQRAVGNSLQSLPDKYKEPLILCYLEDLSYKEIADIMQIPVATVGTRIKRAKKMLKPILEKQRLSY